VLDLCFQHSLMILVLTWFYLVFHFDDHPWLLIPIPLMWYGVVLCRNIGNYRCLDVFALHLYINCMGGNSGSILSCPSPIAGVYSYAPSCSIVNSVALLPLQRLYSCVTGYEPRALGTSLIALHTLAYHPPLHSPSRAHCLSNHRNLCSHQLVDALSVANLNLIAIALIDHARITSQVCSSQDWWLCHLGAPDRHLPSLQGLVQCR